MAARRVLVEVKIERSAPPEAAITAARAWDYLGFVVDQTYKAVPMGSAGDSPHKTVIIRGTLRDAARLEELMRLPEVAGVWDDAPIAPMGLA